jgi:hypothetical protein
MIKNVIGLYVKCLLFCPIVMSLGISGQVFEKFSNIEFHENPSAGSRAVPCGQTDKHDEANSRFSQFCERTKNRP